MSPLWCTEVQRRWSPETFPLLTRNRSRQPLCQEDTAYGGWPVGRVSRSAAYISDKLVEHAAAKNFHSCHKLATRAVSVKWFGEFSFLQLSLQFIFSLHTETITETIPCLFFPPQKTNVLTANPPVFFFLEWLLVQQEAQSKKLSIMIQSAYDRPASCCEHTL